MPIFSKKIDMYCKKDERRYTHIFRLREQNQMKDEQSNNT